MIHHGAMLFENAQGLIAFKKAAHLLEDIQRALVNLFNFVLGQYFELTAFDIPFVHCCFLSIFGGGQVWLTAPLFR